MSETDSEPRVLREEWSDDVRLRSGSKRPKAKRAVELWRNALGVWPGQQAVATYPSIKNNALIQGVIFYDSDSNLSQK